MRLISPPWTWTSGSNEMSEPVCPKCNVAGVDHIVSKDSKERSLAKQPWFIIVHCNQCGHVYNVLTKHVFAETTGPKLVIPKL
jgi:uncharacterized Zn finger protein